MTVPVASNAVWVSCMIFTVSKTVTVTKTVAVSTTYANMSITCTVSATGTSIASFVLTEFGNNEVFSCACKAFIC